MTATEEQARTALAGAGIKDPTPTLIELAQRAIEDAREAVESDPDANTNESAHEIADSLATGEGLDTINGSRDALAYDSELAPPDAGIERRAQAIVFEVLSSIASGAIEDARPPVEEMEWPNWNARGERCVGRSEDEGFIYIRAELRERRGVLELGISGSTRDSGGQIDMHLQPEGFEIHPDLTYGYVRRLWDIWDHWHLNGMRAYCVHQREFAKLAGVKPHEMFLTSFELGGGLSGTNARMLQGEAHAMCPVCGYTYGSSWLREPIPDSVVEFIRDFTAR